jgi:hypothetical protein
MTGPIDINEARRIQGLREESSTSNAASTTWGGGSVPPNKPPTTFGDASSWDFNYDSSLDWRWCPNCGQYTTLRHICTGTGWPNTTYTYVNPIFQEIKELLERLVAAYETEPVELEVAEFHPERPFILHFKGRSLPHETIDGIRTQLDDYISGKDTRPLVFSYDGEVSWVPEPPEES